MTVVIVFGVSGSGKSTVGKALAQRLGVDFAEGDDFHPPSNVKKMTAGEPLTDADRWPWLAKLKEWMGRHNEGVVASSALRQSYRDYLGPARFVFLKITPDDAVARLAARRGHFFNLRLLDSQFAALEEPPAGTLVVDATRSVPEIVQLILDDCQRVAASDS